jgi:predicted metalloprotease with PDZ domain
MDIPPAKYATKKPKWKLDLHLLYNFDVFLLGRVGLLHSLLAILVSERKEFIMNQKISKIVLCLFILASSSALAGDHQKACDKPVQDCLNGMIAKLKNTGFIGVELDCDKCKNEKSKIFRVSKVIPNTPAEKAGIQVGDILVSINGISFSEGNHEAISKVKRPGEKVTCTIRRNGANREITMILAPMPADVMAGYIGKHMMLHAQQEKDKKEKNPESNP